jgi:hypothetical protein
VILSAGSVAVVVFVGGCFATIACLADVLLSSFLFGGCFGVVVVLLCECLSAGCDWSPSPCLAVV